MSKRSPTPKSRKPHEDKLTPEQIATLQARMQLLAERNPSWKISSNDYGRLYEYVAAQKITYLYDDELFEGYSGFLMAKLEMRKEVLLGECA